MGVVYKGLDQRLHRHVALKVLPTAVSADEGRRRLFLREARAASAPNDAYTRAIQLLRKLLLAKDPSQSGRRSPTSWRAGETMHWRRSSGR